MDIISLYETLESRNKLVLETNKMDLNFYFNNNFKQFERALIDQKHEFTKFCERDIQISKDFESKIQEMKDKINLKKTASETNSRKDPHS